MKKLIVYWSHIFDRINGITQQPDALSLTPVRFSEPTGQAGHTPMK